jgi:hypothetical protein
LESYQNIQTGSRMRHSYFKTKKYSLEYERQNKLPNF